MPLTPLQQLIADKAAQMGIDPAWALAQAHQESGGTFDNSKTGSKGEIGIFQVMPSTGADMGYTPEQLRVPETNIEAGLRYHRQRGLAGYNPRDKNYVNDVGRWVPQYTDLIGEGRVAINPTSFQQVSSRDDLERRLDRRSPRQQPAPGGQPAPGVQSADDLERRIDQLKPFAQTAPQGPTLESLKGLSDEQILSKMGYDPKVVMSSNFYQPDIFSDAIKANRFQGTIGQIGYGVTSQAGEAAELGARALRAPAASQYFEARNRLDRMIYDANPKNFVVGGIDVPAAVGATLPMAVIGTALPATRYGGQPYNTLSSIGRGAQLAAEGAVGGVLQPTYRDRPMSDAEYARAKGGQAAMGVGSSLLTQGVTTGTGTLATMRQGTAPSNAAVRGAINRADDTVQSSMGNLTGQARQTAREGLTMFDLKKAGYNVSREEAQGLMNLQRHMDATATAGRAAGIVGGVAAGLSGWDPRALVGGGVGEGLHLLLNTQSGRNMVIAASKVAPGTPAMDQLVRDMQQFGTSAAMQP